MYPQLPFVRGLHTLDFNETGFPGAQALWVLDSFTWYTMARLV